MQEVYDIYVDGCCTNNGKSNAKAGIGIFRDPPYAMSIAEPVVGRATNNEAEIQAATRALEEAYRQGLWRVRIISDSAFVVNTVENLLDNWAENDNWRKARGAPVVNEESWRKLHYARCKLDQVEWMHVEGHTGVPGNEKADRLARKGALMYQS